LTYAIPIRLKVPGLLLAALCALVAVSGTARAKELTFEEVFNTKGEPRALHFTGVYANQGGEHTLEVWRDGDRRLKRLTDGTVETYVFRKQGSAEFQMSVVDQKKKIHTRVDRSNLYRLGSFVDWFDLAHVVRHPVGAYKVAKAAPAADAPKGGRECQWYALARKDGTTRICWSAPLGLPVVIQGGDGKILWKLTRAESKPISPKIYEIHDAGFVRNDANEDISGD